MQAPLVHYKLPVESGCVSNEDLRAVEFYFFVKKDPSLMWKVAPGAGNPFKSNGGARRTFQGVKIVNWYYLGF